MKVFWRVAGCLIAAIALLFALSLLGVPLPSQITVKSSGVAYPGFVTGGAAIILLSSALALATYGVIIGAWDRLPHLKRPEMRPETADAATLALLAALAFLVSYKFAYPPNFGPTNFRILWIDPLVPGRDDWIDTLYFLPTFFKIRFVDHPSLFVALCVTVSTACFYKICRMAGMSLALSAAATASFVLSGHMLLFYQPVEDVTFVTAVALVVVLALLSRNAWFFGAALAAFVLTRPFAFSFVIAVGLAEAIVGPPRGADTAPEFKGVVDWMLGVFRNTFLMASVAISVAIVASFHIYWALTDTHFLQIGLPSIRPKPVEGFTIYNFSGAVLAHALWYFPPFVVAAAAAAAAGQNVVAAGDSSSAARKLVLIGPIFFVLNVIFFEAIGFSSLYVNIRYLAYPYPFLLLAAWAFVDLRRDTVTKAALSGLIVVASLFGSSVNVVKDIAGPRTKNALLALYDKNDELRSLLGGHKALIEQASCDRSTFNWIAAFNRSVVTCGPIPDALEGRDLVVVTRNDLSHRPELQRRLQAAGLNFYTAAGK